MSRLLKLKQWVTLADAAEQLTMTAGETVTETDVLLFAIDGQLPISVNFVTEAIGQQCVVLPTETKSADEATQETIFAEEISRNHLKVSFLLGNKTALLSNPNIQPPVTITGVWDLAMIGGELDYVKNQLMGKLGKKEIEPSLDDLVITRQGTDEYFSLLRCEAGAQKISYVSAIHMPESAFLVVRTDALLDFQRQLLIEESQPHNPVNHVSEPKNSHLLIIAALLELQGKAVTQARQARNQSAIMDIVLESYGDIRGLGKRTLQEIFSSANKAMKAERSAK